MNPTLPPGGARLDLTTGEMIRAGRAISRIEQSDLADAAGVSLETVKRLERIRGPVNANVRTLRALTSAFEALGVRFFNDGGRQCVCIGVPGRDPRWLQLEEGPSEPEIVFRAIYHSVAVAGSSSELQAVLDEILLTATATNAKLGLTGALLAADGRFLQVLEGPRTAVFQVLGQIAMDRRHHQFTPLDYRPAEGRLFGDWLMAGRFSPSSSAPDLAEPGSFGPEAFSADAAVELLLEVCAQERSALA